jgi:hypothetical protein
MCILFVHKYRCSYHLNPELKPNIDYLCGSHGQNIAVYFSNHTENHRMYQQITWSDQKVSYHISFLLNKKELGDGSG